MRGHPTKCSTISRKLQSRRHVRGGKEGGGRTWRRRRKVREEEA